MSKISEVSDQQCNYALERAREALSGDTAVDRVAKYYAIDSNYAGSLYLGIPDLDRSAITAADLFAVSTLNVEISTRGARRFLLEPGGADSVNEALSALPEKPVSEVDDADLRRMETFYLVVKESLTKAKTTRKSGAWVTASKIAARKRPRLFPVRDTVVTTLLGTRKAADYFTDWIVFRHLMNDAGIAEGLERIANALAARPNQDDYLFESEPLRLLDVALWTYAKKD
ncbi:MAG: DUF6308 family protein [Brachybacterium sp.]